jgi:hypothetical protein
MEISFVAEVWRPKPKEISDSPSIRASHMCLIAVMARSWQINDMLYAALLGSIV